MAVAEIPLGEYIHIGTGRRYEVVGNGLDSTGYEETERVVPTVHFRALEEGQYPIDTQWTRTRKDFQKQFCRITEGDEPPLVLVSDTTKSKD